MPERIVSNNARLIVSFVVMAVLIAASVVGSYALSLHAIQKSQSQWCDTLSLLTTNPHPATKSAKEFYAKLGQLEQQFGCKS